VVIDKGEIESYDVDLKTKKVEAIGKITHEALKEKIQKTGKKVRSVRSFDRDLCLTALVTDHFSQV
jgi:hypothetical protein